MKFSSTNRSAVKRSSGGRHGRKLRSRPRVEEKQPVPVIAVRVPSKGWGVRWASARLIKQGRYVYLAWRGPKGPTRFYLGSIKNSSSTGGSAGGPGPRAGAGDVLDLASSECRRKKRSRNAR